MWPHMLAGTYIQCRQPVVRQVTPPRCIILGNIARNIGQLEGKAEVAGTIKCCFLVRGYAHHHGHHDPDCACDMVTIAVKIIFPPGVPVGGIQRKALDHILGHFCG